MTAPKTIEPDEPFGDIEDQLSHTHTFLLASALTKPLAAPFAQLLGELEGHRATETALVRAVAAQEARAVFADDALDLLVDDTKTEVLIEVGQDYTAPLYKQLFGSQSPSELKRPQLGAQLETMRTWPAILGQTANAKLQAIADRIVKAIQAADDVLAALAQAEAALTTFQSGPRAAFVGACNAARAALFGKLSEMASAPNGGPLPAGFVDRFFLRETGGRAPRLDEVEKAIARLRSRLAKQEALRDELKGKAQKAQKARLEAELAARKAKLAAKQRAADVEAADIAALEAELAKTAGG